MEKQKLTKEELKELRSKNLNRKGRPKGAKNKVTESKLVNMIETFMRDRNQEKINIKEKAKEVVTPVEEIQLQEVITEVKEKPLKPDPVEKPVKQIKLENKTEKPQKDWIDDLFD
jgi:sugar-specific transcriptional regulator TrmB